MEDGEYEEFVKNREEQKQKKDSPLDPSLMF